LKRDEATARRERAKREGQYKSGINMQDEEVDGNQPPAAKRARAPRRQQATCKDCGGKDHASKRSRKCLHYTGPAPARREDADADQTVDPAEDIDNLELIPLVRDQQEQLDTKEDVEALHAFFTADGGGAGGDDVGIVRANI
jgi:hypothetical protein